MQENLYKCVNNCKSPFLPEEAAKYEFNICPVCGQLYPQTIIFIKNYFRIIQLLEELNEASDLLLKSETASSVREALVVLESLVRDKSGLVDLSGQDLMAKAFSFKYDKDKKIMIEEPRIKINALKSISQLNEQEGIKFMSMGLMQGIRNIYMHSKGSRRLYYAIQIITAHRTIVWVAGQGRN